MLERSREQDLVCERNSANKTLKRLSRLFWWAHLCPLFQLALKILSMCLGRLYLLGFITLATLKINTALYFVYLDRFWFLLFFFWNPYISGSGEKNLPLVGRPWLAPTRKREPVILRQSAWHVLNSMQLQWRGAASLWPSKPNCRFKKKKQQPVTQHEERERNWTTRRCVFPSISLHLSESAWQSRAEKSGSNTVLIPLHFSFLAALLSEQFVWGMRDVQSIDVTRARLF